MTTPFTAWRQGLGRVLRAPAILAGVWLLTLAVSLPLALGLRSMIEQHLGSSLAADTAVTGVNYDWWEEFNDQATGLGVSFKPTIIGFGAVLDNLSAFLDEDTRPVVILGAAAAYVALWIFLAGGIIDRYARERATRAAGFFAACGVFFFRFLRLAVVMAIVYGLLFHYVHGWLFDTLYPRLIHDVNVERTAFFIRAGLYLVFALLAAGCNLVFDYAKVRAVVEDRHSMLGAVAAALRFVRRNPGGVDRPLRDRRRAVRRGARRVRRGRARRGRRRLVGVDGTRDRPGVHPGAAVREARLLGVRDGAVSGTPRARRLRRRAEAGVARVAGRRSDWTLTAP